MINSAILLEKLANLEHERWSHWMRWMFANWTEENILRWKLQMETPYSNLPERSKESDRKEARKTLALLMLEELVAKHGEEYRRLIVDALKYYEDHRRVWGVSFDQEKYIDELVERTSTST